MCFLFHDCSIDRNNANFFGKLSIDNKEQDYYYLALKRDLTLYDDVPLQVFETAAIHFEKSPSFGWCEHRRERGGNGSSNTANSLRFRTRQNGWEGYAMSETRERANFKRFSIRI